MLYCPKMVRVFLAPNREEEVWAVRSSGSANLAGCLLGCMAIKMLEIPQSVT